MRRIRVSRRSASSIDSNTEVITPNHNRPAWGRRVYAIAFDLDTDTMKRLYHNAHWEYGYDQIRAVFEKHGFHRQQGSVYFGNDKVDPVRCVLAVQDAANKLPWFRASIVDIRMLRIEENNDLLPAVGDPDLFDAAPQLNAPASLPAE